MNVTRQGASRRKRFAPCKPFEGLTLTERDQRILKALARFRFLRSDQIVRIAGGSAQGVLRRLRELFDARYVDRPRAQIASIVFGNRPMIYGLGDEGAAWLKENTSSDDLPLTRWRERNGAATNAFVEHTADLAEFFIALEADVASQKGARILYAEDIFEDRSLKWDTRWDVSFLWRDGLAVEMTLAPDGFVGLETEDGKRRYFFVEIDTGTEPISRRDQKQSSIEKKFRAYAALAKSMRLTNFRPRTLFVTTSAARMQNMIDALPSGLRKRDFLFASLNDISKSPLTASWRDGAGDEVLLLEARTYKAR